MKTITLKTLPRATKQQVFDQVAKHLRSQLRQSQSHGACMYHGDNGLMCAAGCLIAPGELTSEMQGDLCSMGWVDLVRIQVVPKKHTELISILQGTHDTMPDAEWSIDELNRRLATVAQNFKLNYSETGV